MTSTRSRFRESLESLQVSFRGELICDGQMKDHDGSATENFHFFPLANLDSIFTGLTEGLAN
jgi:hypothetical protein